MELYTLACSLFVVPGLGYFPAVVLSASVLLGMRKIPLFKQYQQQQQQQQQQGELGKTNVDKAVNHLK